MFYLISDTVSFVLVDIIPTYDSFDSYVLCAGTQKESEDVHELWVKWWEYSLYEMNGFDYLNDEELKRKYFSEWVSINRIELDNEPVNINPFDVDALDELQESLFVKVIEKMEYSGYKRVPTDIFMNN